MSITPSQLGRLAICPASGALPEVRIESAAMRLGTITHDYLDRCADGDRDAALATVPAEHRDFCDAIPLERLPFDLLGGRIISEPAYAYNVATGAARLIGRRVERQYGQVSAMEIPGSMDVLEVFGPAVAVADYKVGFGIDLLAPEPAKNLQLKTYALMAARAHGKDHAEIRRIRISENAEVWVDEPHEMDAFDLDDHADHVARIHARVMQAREEVLTGRQPSVTVSEHCRYCPAFQACPAQTQLVRQIATAPEEIERFIAESLTPATAAKAYERIILVESVTARARKALEAYASRTPIDLGDGRVFGPVETTRESVDGGLAESILREEFGDGVAAAAVSTSVTKTALKDALRDYAKGAGISLSKAEKQALATLREAGAITETSSQTVKEHKA